jgi:hypothetical protein
VVNSSLATVGWSFAVASITMSSRMRLVSCKDAKMPLSRALANDCVLICDQSTLEPYQLAAHQASLRTDAIEIIIQ